MEIASSFETGLHLRTQHGWKWVHCAPCSGSGCELCDFEGLVLRYKDRVPCGPLCPLHKKKGGGRC